MIEMLNSIPQWFAWTMVGLLSVACAVIWVKIGLVFREMWRDYKEDMNEG